MKKKKKFFPGFYIKLGYGTIPGTGTRYLLTGTTTLVN